MSPPNDSARKRPWLGLSTTRNPVAAQQVKVSRSIFSKSLIPNAPDTEDKVQPQYNKVWRDPLRFDPSISKVESNPQRTLPCKVIQIPMDVRRRQ